MSASLRVRSSRCDTFGNWCRHENDLDSRSTLCEILNIHQATLFIRPKSAVYHTWTESHPWQLEWVIEPHAPHGWKVERRALLQQHSKAKLRWRILKKSSHKHIFVPMISSLRCIKFNKNISFSPSARFSRIDIHFRTNNHISCCWTLNTHISLQSERSVRRLQIWNKFIYDSKLLFVERMRNLYQKWKHRNETRVELEKMCVYVSAQTS